MVLVTPVDPIVDSEGNQDSGTKDFFEQVAELAVILGEGSPENNVEANAGRFYIDQVVERASVVVASSATPQGGSA